MRGKVYRSSIRVEREVEFEISFTSGYEESSVAWNASYDEHLFSITDGLPMEAISLAFRGDTYDAALDRLLAEFTALDIEVTP